jgi:hypothetical protein
MATTRAWRQGVVPPASSAPIAAWASPVELASDAASSPSSSDDLPRRQEGEKLEEEEDENAE